MQELNFLGNTLGRMSPQQQQQFLNWAWQSPMRGSSLDETFNPAAAKLQGYAPDYDIASYYRFGMEPPVPGEGGLHLTDAFKQPNHPTFSNESYFADPTAGHWMDTTLGKHLNSAAYLPSLLGLLAGKTPKRESWK